ncbi:DUF305 domain-containing protein [uncultured Nocardioides sp.]|uniref:DUF305 domain-containing protein n=1 Tax=uncultured Nocardioides sp. TaxID=198441 RepID=UPI0030F5C37A
MPRKHLAAATLVVAGTLTLGACGGHDMSSMSGTGGSDSSSPSSSSDATADFNDADVTFTTEMIPHHRQAVEMAELAETRAESPEVKDLAIQIMNAQDPEIETMTGWLTSWGKPVPEDMSGMDMSGSMPGMMSKDEMASLENTSDADFDQMFLAMMVEHHQGAIEMAKSEQSSGMFPEAIALAKQIESAQTDEIATMQALLR